MQINLSTQEHTVISGLIAYKDDFYSLVELCKREYFTGQHQGRFDLILESEKELNEIIETDIDARWKKAGLLDDSIFDFLLDRVPTIEQIKNSIKILKDRYYSYEIFTKLTEQQQELATGGNYKATAELLTASLEQILSDDLNPLKTRENDFNEAIHDIQVKRQAKGGITGIDTGFSGINKLNGGWQKTDLIILAARPGMGKTSLALQMAANVVRNNQACAVFSLEMGKTQLIQRLAAQKTGISLEMVNRGKISEPQEKEIVKAIEKMYDYPIYIDDEASIHVDSLRMKAKILKKKYDIELLIVDYLQLMRGEGGNREQEISYISRTLKAIAKELKIPVIALSQLSRAVETRGGSKRPQLSDLRESGAIEQDADIVSFIYRPEYYGILEDADGNSVKGLAELIFAKNRHGALDDVNLKFDAEFVRFSDWLENDFQGTQFPTPPPNISTGYGNKLDDDEDIPF